MINSDWKPEFFFAPGFVPSMQPTLLSPAHQLDPMSPPSVAPSQSSQGTSTRCAADPSYSGRGRPGRRRRPAVPDPPDELALQSTFKRKRRPKPTSVAETSSERDCTVCGAPAHGYISFNHPINSRLIVIILEHVSFSDITSIACVARAANPFSDETRGW